MTTDPGRHEQIAAWLGRYATEVHETGSGAWTAVLAGPGVVAGWAKPQAARASVRVDDDWLLFDSPLPDAPLALRDYQVPFWWLLRQNGLLPGGVKYALAPRGRCPRVRAEIPLDCAVSPVSQVGAVSDGIRAAFERWSEWEQVVDGDAAADTAEEGDPPLGGTDQGSESIRNACQETGWPLTERPDGRIMIDLDVPGFYQQATVAPRPGGGAHVWLDLPTPAAGTPTQCRVALGALLLRVCAVARMVRVTAGRAEIILSEEPTSALLTAAFSALSVTGRLVGREAETLLADAVVADAYVRRTGLSLAPRRPAHAVEAA